MAGAATWQCLRENFVMHYPRKRFGQHFLTDQAIIARIVQSILPQSGDHLVEIGPGLGALTAALLAHCQQLDAIEIDRDLAEKLRQQYQHLTHFVLHEIDVLQFDFQKIASKKIKLLGNLPYNISTPLLIYLLDFLGQIETMTFMLQKEVAERIVANPDNKNYGRLSVILQYFCQVEILFSVPSSAFHPAPKVESAIIQLTPRETKIALQDQSLFFAVVKAAFATRRKMIRNTLKDYLSLKDFAALNLDPQLRAENLAVVDFVRICNYLSH